MTDFYVSHSQRETIPRKGEEKCIANYHTNERLTNSCTTLFTYTYVCTGNNMLNDAQTSQLKLNNCALFVDFIVFFIILT